MSCDHQVLDARDPLGTRSKQIEHFLKREKPHKHLIFLLNKCDLVPTWATVRTFGACVVCVPPVSSADSVG